MKQKQWEDAERPRHSFDVDDPEVSRLIDEILAELAPYPDLGLLREVFVTGAKLALDETGRGDVKILRTAIKEIRHGFRVFSHYQNRPKVAIFGSARSLPDSEEFQIGVELGRMLVERGYMVITGAGEGIMGAGHLGAGRENSFGLNINLPFEQAANKTIAEDEKLINFNYFFTRKLFFVKESEALVVMPGGFGTMDETFEALTLIQTGKSDVIPIVMLDSPEGIYWKEWEQFVHHCLLERGLISETDRSLYCVTDSVEKVCDEIQTFYHRYHSMRYVDYKTVLVLRLTQPLDDDQVGQLNKEFSDILVEGRIEQCGCLPEEEDEPEIRELPRLKMRFDQQHFSRLREMIDRINRF